MLAVVCMHLVMGDCSMLALWWLCLWYDGTFYCADALWSCTSVAPVCAVIPGLDPTSTKHQLAPLISSGTACVPGVVTCAYQSAAGMSQVPAVYRLPCRFQASTGSKSFLAQASCWCPVEVVVLGSNGFKDRIRHCCMMLLGVSCFAWHCNATGRNTRRLVTSVTNPVLEVASVW